MQLLPTLVIVVAFLQSSYSVFTYSDYNPNVINRSGDPDLQIALKKYNAQLLEAQMSTPPSFVTPNYIQPGVQRIKHFLDTEKKYGDMESPILYIRTPYTNMISNGDLSVPIQNMGGQFWCDLPDPIVQGSDLWLSHTTLAKIGQKGKCLQAYIIPKQDFYDISLDYRVLKQGQSKPYIKLKSNPPAEKPYEFILPLSDSNYIVRISYVSKIPKGNYALQIGFETYDEGAAIQFDNIVVTPYKRSLDAKPVDTPPQAIDWAQIYTTDQSYFPQLMPQNHRAYAALRLGEGDYVITFDWIVENLTRQLYVGIINQICSITRPTIVGTYAHTFFYHSSEFVSALNLMESASDSLQINIKNLRVSRFCCSSNAYISQRLKTRPQQLIVFPIPLNNNKIESGDFESFDFGGGQWNLFNNSAWKAIKNMEVGFGHLYNGKWGAKNKVAELDAQKNEVYTTVFEGWTESYYELSFSFASREGVKKESCGIAVIFNGKWILHSFPQNKNVYNKHYIVKGLIGMNALSFHGIGTSDSVGITIDDVRVFQYYFRHRPFASSLKYRSLPHYSLKFQELLRG